MPALGNKYQSMLHLENFVPFNSNINGALCTLKNIKI